MQQLSSHFAWTKRTAGAVPSVCKQKVSDTELVGGSEITNLRRSLGCSAQNCSKSSKKYIQKAGWET